MSTPHLDPQPWKTYRDSDGEVMVSIADVLTWIRNCETAWDGTRDDSPVTVAAWFGDQLRDLWLDGTRPECDAP